MKVVLPDSTELELPEGATGLDAAAAIGPKLAKEAVLVRSNGRVQDLRLPLRDGQPIQIVTTRDADDPDALYVLSRSARTRSRRSRPRSDASSTRAARGSGRRSRPTKPSVCSPSRGRTTRSSSSTPLR